MADSDALRARRRRLHAKGDHTLCRPDRCPALGAPPRPAVGDVTSLEKAVEIEFAGEDVMSRALALRLVELSAGPGVGGVAAVKALGELIAAQRGGM
jgi:hypothetical protein